MAFTVQDFQDLLRLLDAHPEWQAELRRRLLSEELLALPSLVRQLLEAQAHTEQRLEVLAARVGELAAAQQRTEQRVDALAAQVGELTARVGELAAAQQRTEHHLAELSAAQRQMSIQVSSLTLQVAEMNNRLGRHDGQLLEMEYRAKATGRLGRVLRRARVLDTGVLVERLDDAVDEGKMTFDERNALLNVDIVVEGRRYEDQQPLYVLMEVSSTIDFEDLGRIISWSRIMEKLGRPVVPVLAGRFLEEEVDAAARNAGVWRLLDGRAIPPDEPAVAPPPAPMVP